MQSKDEIIELIIKVAEIEWSCLPMTFHRHCTIKEALLIISNSEKIPVRHPEAYGLCRETPELDKLRKRQVKKGLKVGSFRDETEWLDDNHSLEFYSLKNGDTLIFKVKNIHLSVQRVRIRIPSRHLEEIEIKYNYLTTVDETIKRILLVDDYKHWALLLPTGLIDGRIVSLWLDPNRTLASYNLYGRQAMEILEGSGPSFTRLLVLTQDPRGSHFIFTR
eukprot:TRINITY_DN10735_c0_g1_i10.p1 TRINITY_DN10735_c0_g1~~TRINITY_DN10735_c0_g1_i10.p1  ORF type:complete len:220 (-),score=25.48 TRINITY_DN10735_c0_g1_i10:476-1135(-)